MDELTSQQIGHISLTLYRSRNSEKREKYDYIKLEWGADFHQHQSFLAADDVPVLTTTSAHLTRQLLHTTGACAFLPDTWHSLYPDLLVIPDTPVAVRPLYAVWLQNSDQQTHIRQLLKFPVIN